MSNIEEFHIIKVYCKIPFTEISHTFVVQDNLTICEFLQFTNIYLHNKLNINTKYDIELVVVGQPLKEFAPPLESRDSQRLRDKFSNISNLIAFYARPINPNTREFVRQNDYST